ncbi:MAG: zinc ribbon domain-containing protein [Deltaproteobacteria bacterium]|nr:zinc ribbon domain-containing protein [Deltaproteobacteria bacterium]
MPIYEFYCTDCNTIYNFFSKSINTTRTPPCPKCKTDTMSRQVSMFAVTGRASEDEGDADLPFDESKLEKAMTMLEKEAGSINEDDPKQAADLMRKLTDMTGMELGPGMQEALRRMENGEDPDQIEAEMGSLLEDEEPFMLSDAKGKGMKAKRPKPKRDETLYDL